MSTLPISVDSAVPSAEVNVPAIFAPIVDMSHPDTFIGELVKQAHIVIGAAPDNTDQVSGTLRDILSRIEQPQPIIDAAHELFRSANIETIFEVGDEILAAAKEHAMRDAEPPRTLDVHIREMLDAGDEPTALYQVLVAWTNPEHDPQKTEDIRYAVSDEWARKLALEQQTPETIHASLRLHLPDSPDDGRNHSALASRVWAQVHGVEQPQAHTLASTLMQPSQQMDPHPELQSQAPKR